MGGEGVSTLFQPAIDRSNAYSNDAPNFIFGTKSNYGRVILSGFTH
jgi:hypothetical protein